MLIIAINTISEMFKKKFIHVISIIVIIYLIIYAIFVNKFMGAMDIQTLNTYDIFIRSTSIILLLGFYFSSMLISFMTIVSTMGTVSLEIENNIVSTILARPIRRSTYILGKLLGSNILIWIYSTIVFVLILLIGYIMDVPSIESLSVERLIKSWLFFIIQPTAIISLSIFGGTVFKTLSNGMFVIFIYILGIIGSYIEQVGSMTKNKTMMSIGIISSLISPFETIYRKMFSYISESFVVSPIFGNLVNGTEPSIWMINYIYIYIIVFSFVGIKLFNKKNL